MKVPASLTVAIELVASRVFEKGSWNHQSKKFSHLKTYNALWQKLDRKYRSGKSEEEIVEYWNAAVFAIEEGSG